MIARLAIPIVGSGDIRNAVHGTQVAEPIPPSIVQHEDVQLVLWPVELLEADNRPLENRPFLIIGRHPRIHGRQCGGITRPPQTLVAVRFRRPVCQPHELQQRHEEFAEGGTFKEIERPHPHGTTDLAGSCRDQEASAPIQIEEDCSDRGEAEPQPHPVMFVRPHRHEQQDQTSNTKEQRNMESGEQHRRPLST